MVLQKLLSLYHPHKDKLFYEHNPVKIAESQLDWLEFEVEDLRTYQDRYLFKSHISLSGSEFINFGKYETAQELLRLIKEEWEVTDE